MTRKRRDDERDPRRKNTIKVGGNGDKLNGKAKEEIRRLNKREVELSHSVDAAKTLAFALAAF